MKTKTVEVLFILDSGLWDTDFCEIPEVIADTESQDCFLKWAYGPSKEAKVFLDDVSPVVALFVFDWEPIDPNVGDPDKIIM